MNKILWVDLDEVLAETIDEVLKYHNYSINNMSITKNDISDYYLSNINKYNINRQQAINFFSEILTTSARENILPVQWAKEKLETLHKQWWKINIVTARREEIADYTHKWLDKYYPNLIDNILFANHFSDKEVPKSNLCLQKGIDYMIEDNLDFALELAQFGIKVYLLDKPWNRHYNSLIHLWVTKVYSRSEINL